ncbi:MAG: lytic transglycosylase domain-containing protein [Gammaproteobacteria bacterium]|nr:lytic transglycosylase domain-containing protein [Gammaproteobacteria bacterium]
MLGRVLFFCKPNILIGLIAQLVFVTLSLAPIAQAAEKETLQELRSIFESAERNLKSGKLSAYRQQRAILEGYPLVAYLDHQEMAKGGNKPRDLERFLDKYPNFPYNKPLRRKLLNHYYERSSWRRIARMEPARDDVCLHLLTLHKLKRDPEQVLTRIKELWLGGYRFNEKCEALMRSMKLRLYSNNNILWDRIDGAVSNKNWVAIRETSKYIPKSQRAAYNSMVNLRRSSRRYLKRELPKMSNTKPYRIVLTYALTKYPSDHIMEAYELYKGQLSADFSFSPEQRNAIEYHLGLFLTIENHAQGFIVMRELNPIMLKDEQHEWRARSAIKFGQWQNLASFIDDFPPDLQEKADWLYWKGYALTKVGKRKDARKLFAQAAKDRSFYGFLAAERVGTPLSINQASTPRGEGASILAQASFKRFFEFNAIKRTRQALSEWETTLRLANQDELLYLASAAYAKGWHFHSIRAFAVAQYWDDLHRRFPTPYLDEVKTAARNSRLDPSLIYAIMRTESSFRPDIASSAGAVGLMQLLPSTGRSMMRKINYKGSRRLTNPQTSIDVGSSYLRSLLTMHKGNLVLTIASYNAGPYAVREWIPAQGRVPAVEWIETVPYGETRKYLRSIFYAQTIFSWRLGDRNPSIGDKLESIGKI